MSVASKTWAVNEIVSAADMNTYIRDNFSDVENGYLRIETGTYTGDGSTGQQINLSDANIIVKYVRIWERKTSDAAAGVHETTDVIIDDAANGQAFDIQGTVLQARDDRITELGTGYFTVSDNGSNAAPNANTYLYNYFVFGSYA